MWAEKQRLALEAAENKDHLKKNLAYFAADLEDRPDPHALKKVRKNGAWTSSGSFHSLGIAL
jgi:hypothetical protein